jgi:hypothetical protein
MARQRKPADAVQFTYESAERIANVVRAAETTPPSASPLTFDKRFADRPPKQVRIGTFSGAWAVNATKTVTFKFVTETPNTALVTNLVCGLSPSGSCDVSIARDGSAWFLLQPNLTQLPGFSSSGTQVLAVVGGNLRFVGTTSCT